MSIASDFKIFWDCNAFQSACTNRCNQGRNCDCTQQHYEAVAPEGGNYYPQTEAKIYPAPGWNEYAVALGKILATTLSIAALAVGISLLILI